MTTFALKKFKNANFAFLLKFLILANILLPFEALASSTTLTVTVVYAVTESQFSSASPSTQSVSNPNDTSVYVDLSFPADSLSSGATVSATIYSTAESAVTTDAPLPSGKLAANTFYNFSFTNVSTGAAVTSFDQAVTLTFFYSDADVSGIDESTLVPYRWNGTSWVALSGYTLDTAANKVTVTTQQFSTFALLGTAPVQQQQQQQAPSVGGGGGGGAPYVPPQPQLVTQVIFSGRAYPKSTVTLLKDAQIAATTVAGTDANFKITLSNLSSGNYIFSIYGEDNKANRSSLLTFPISVTAGATTSVSGIFIAPTVAVDKSEVKRGENIAIFGQTAPKADVTIQVNSEEEFFSKIISDASGIYLYNFDTTVLEYGMHYTKAKSSVGNLDISGFSRAVSFKVGAKTILSKLPVETAAKGDLNSDRRINLIDFSIAAYWYKRLAPPAHADLNSDGKVDLVDFSIMAYYWTG